LRWRDVDLGQAVPVIEVERSLEQTKAGGLRFKAPKTKHGRRAISLPQSSVDLLRDHRRAQLGLRLHLRMGKHEPYALVFFNHDGSPISPNYFSIMWIRALAANPDLPQVTFHALRQSHASAIARR
jgi:integrase